MNTTKPSVLNQVRQLIQGSTLSPTLKGLATMSITALPPEKVEEIIGVFRDIVRILAKDPEGINLLKRIGVNPNDLPTSPRQ